MDILNTGSSPEIDAVCLMGPTAVGKTALAIDLSQRFPVEIVSVDSAQVYRGMSIGTGKPSAEELSLAPHHLIDVVEPFQSYSAAKFCRDALRLIKEIKARGRIPFLVGGTMLYFRALKDGLAVMPIADQSVRSDITLMAEKEGWDAVHARLKDVDPASAARIHRNDSQRIQRALEVFIVTGKSMTRLQEDSKRVLQPAPSLMFFSIQPEDRSVLHSRIECRFYKMLEKGLVDEVVALRERKDLDSTMASMRVVGYRQIWSYLDKALTYEDMVGKSIAATRQLAKRQLTWLRSWNELNTSCNDLEPTLEHLSSTLKL